MAVHWCVIVARVKIDDGVGIEGENDLIIYVQKLIRHYDRLD